MGVLTLESVGWSSVGHPANGATCVGFIPPEGLLDLELGLPHSLRSFDLLLLARLDSIEDCHSTSECITCDGLLTWEFVLCVPSRVDLALRPTRQPTMNNNRHEGFGDLDPEKARSISMPHSAVPVLCRATPTLVPERGPQMQFPKL